MAADLSSDHTPRTNARVQLPFRQAPSTEVIVYLRARGDPQLLVRPLEDAVRVLSSDVSLNRITTLAARFEEAGGPVRAFSVLGLAFGAAGLLLAVVGAYGVTAFAVQRRTREFGIRIALGAKPARCARVCIQTRRTTTRARVGCGRDARLGGGQTGASGRQHGRGVDFPFAYVLALGVISVAVAIALWTPARRAAKSDPMLALRAE